MPGGIEQVDDAVRYRNCSAVEVIEMPRSFSIAIQSDTVERRPLYRGSRRLR